MGQRRITFAGRQAYTTLGYSGSAAISLRICGLAKTAEEHNCDEAFTAIKHDIYTTVLTEINYFSP
jgi:hypothetical protein